MSIYESLRTATTGLTTNKMRAALTMLGIIIGVASVVALLSIGEGVEEAITGEIQGLGANLIFITADQPEDSTSPAFITTADAEALEDPFNAPSLVAVAPAMQGNLRVDHGDEAASLFYRPGDAESLEHQLESVAWFGDFLQRYRKSFILICHDREFLDEQIDRVVPKGRPLAAQDGVPPAVLARVL